MILDVASALLVLLAAVNILSTVLLVTAALRHHWPALEERATVAVILAVAALGAAVLGLARLRIIPSLPSEISTGILVVGLCLISLPSLIWLVAFLAGRFDEADDSGEEGRP